MPAAEATLDGAPWTIGVGHTGAARARRPALVGGAQIDAALARDIAAVCEALDDAVPWWRTLDDARQDVLAQMAFQMGVAGVVRFRTTLAHIQAGRFSEAADAMLKSAWARQTPPAPNGSPRRCAQERSGERRRPDRLGAPP